MAEEITVEVIEESDRDGGLRFSEKKYHNQPANSPNIVDREAEIGAEDLKDNGEDDDLDSDDVDVVMPKVRDFPQAGKNAGDEVSYGLKRGSLVRDLCPDLSDESDWFGQLKDKNLSGLCMKDFQDILFDSVEEAEKFYSYYAFMVGFSKKKWKIDKKVYDGVEMITRRAWACSKQGTCVPKRKQMGEFDDPNDTDAEEEEDEPSDVDENDKTKGPQLVRRKKTKKSVGRDRRYSRTGCKCFMAIKLLKEKGKYQVTRFLTTHNHGLADIFERHFLRSNRKVTMQDILEVEALGDANVHTSAAFNYLVQQSGGREFVGFMLKDLYNKMATHNQSKTRFGDAEAAMNWLRVRGSEEEQFFCRYTQDSKKRLAGLFWRDSQSLMDYQLYGDVLVIDATYKTNVYGMPLVLFVGTNNHRATVVFACALLCNEKVAAYYWVIEKFLQSMNNLRPKSVVTDGCESMRKALNKHLPEIKHRLCAWHIGRNVGQNMKDPDLQKALGKLIYTSYSIQEWEREWARISVKHKVQNNAWMKTLYEKRKKWAEAFCRGQWFGGICTTQRCEGMNHTFKLEVGKYTTLNDFIPRYQRGICRMRDRVLLDNFKSRNHCREYKTHMSSMEEFVFNTFTDDIYLVIRNQIDFEKKFRVSSRFPDWDSNNLMLYVTQYDKEDRRWAVQYIACSSEKEEDETYSCSCQLFESDGIPCAHIFCVMKSEGVRHYPKSLICPRWKKSNGRRPVQMTCAEDEGSGFKPSRYLTLIAAAKRACYNLASTQEGFKKGIAAMNKLEEESFEFRVPKKPRRMVGDNDNVVRDPKVAQTKGTHWNTENGNKTNGDHVNKCRTCKQPGHNKRSCPNKHLFTEKEGEDRPDPPLSQSSYGIQKCLTLGADNRAPASCHPPSIPEHNGLNNLNQELPDMNSQVSDSGEPLLDHSLWAGH